MSDQFHWTCPKCTHDAIIRHGDYTAGTVSMYPNYAKGVGGKDYCGLYYLYVRCPNAECLSYELTVKHVPVTYAERGSDTYHIDRAYSSWRFYPRSNSKVFPDYVPVAVKADYEEACLIRELSPKASATLARRCLQGIIRDFWQVKVGRLFDEIKAIKDKCDPLTWDAIEAVRKVGNIGAHMEADINIILDVEPNEAALLIELIETLVSDWYVTRHERKNRLKAVSNLAISKADEKTAAKDAKS